MEVAKILVRGTSATVAYRKNITSGMVGATVAFEVDSLWDDLQIMAVFKSGATVKDASYDPVGTVVPHEVVASPGKRLYVGLYGVNVDGRIVIPTVWANLGMIFCGADPSGDESADPSLPVWAELQEAIGDLESLETTDKSSLVAAVNEAAKSGGSVKSVNDIAPDEKGNVQIDIEAVVMDTMIALNVAPVLLDNGAVLTDSDGAILLNM